MAEIFRVVDNGANDPETQKAKGGPEDIAAQIAYQMSKILNTAPNLLTLQQKQYFEKHKLAFDAARRAKNTLPSTE